MRIQLFDAPHSWTIVGEGTVENDQFARPYIDGVRVAFAVADGPFTVLHCSDGRARFVMTSDWSAVKRLPARPRQG